MSAAMREEAPEILVVGGGPAGLMAAERLAARGRRVVIAEGRPSLARKFLMAGKSGLNLTKDEPPEAFAARISAPWLRDIVAAFGPAEVRAWAEGLGVPLFAGSTGRVFPVAMKASPLLRAWLARLAGLGVEIRTRWLWEGFEAGALVFSTPQGRRLLRPGRTVLALGGASWPRLGSDGAWVPWLRAAGVEVAPLRPANAGLRVRWSAHMAPFMGAPVKGARLIAGDLRAPRAESRGEFVLSARGGPEAGASGEGGLEGGGIYTVCAAVRDGAALHLDLLPDLTAETIAARLALPRGKASRARHLRAALRLDPLRAALLNEWGRPLPEAPGALAARIKALPVPHLGPRPLAQAISSAGGITQASLTPGLGLRALPGVHACGEMLDWEAPTGGYLLTACLATGHHLGNSL